jgi:hypothetical protein
MEVETAPPEWIRWAYFHSLHWLGAIYERASFSISYCTCWQRETWALHLNGSVADGRKGWGARVLVQSMICLLQTQVSILCVAVVTEPCCYPDDQHFTARPPWPVGRTSHVTVLLLNSTLYCNPKIESCPLVQKQPKSEARVARFGSYISKRPQQNDSSCAQYRSNLTDRKPPQPFRPCPGCRNNPPHTLTHCPILWPCCMAMTIWRAERRCLWGSESWFPKFIGLDQEPSLLKSLPLPQSPLAREQNLCICHKHHCLQWRDSCLPLPELIEQEKPGCILISCIA